MSTEPDRIRSDIERTRAELSSDVDALTDRVSPSRIAERQTDKVKSAVSNAKEKVFGAAEDARPSASDSAGSAADTVAGAAHVAADRIGHAPHLVKEKATGNPWAAGLIAFGAGLLAGSLIPSSRKEQELVTQAKDSDVVHRATGEARSIAQEVGEDLKQPARDAAQAVKETATEGAQDVKESAMSGAEEVRDSGRQAAEDVRGEAEQSRDRLQGS
ncbi:DUF3618 domain-containing protein [Occultella kanbiaonis]|uniref:DUF3618 domain-containing protein n=1 Tax=Occultella kanbiaonis TaxID=2675754 RepID=UPI0012B9172B|nr:DUF3618 domain-containing protein [Occultella kanbiaonis]